MQLKQLFLQRSKNLLIVDERTNITFFFSKQVSVLCFEKMPTAKMTTTHFATAETGLERSEDENDDDDGDDDDEALWQVSDEQLTESLESALLVFHIRSKRRKWAWEGREKLVENTFDLRRSLLQLPTAVVQFFEQQCFTKYLKEDLTFAFWSSKGLFWLMLASF